MEALKMRLFAVVILMVLAVSAVQNVAIAEAPTSAPTSDAVYNLRTKLR
ncbi:arabinogalactan protein 13-like [Macadamia integrifolia]|nr:arabinogalactan protein 13-like [Macadamia integrifolia]